MTTWKIPEACADISESDIRRQDEEVLRLLLVDRTLTSHNGRWTNIKWCTGDYALSHSGVVGFSAEDEIQMDLISSADGRDLKVVTPRVAKSKEEQRRRSVEHAEVFTPSWICNEQNNLVDAAWFGRKDNLFNVPNPQFESELDYSNCRALRWKPLLGAKNAIRFARSKGRSSHDYVKALRLEVSCGEAPYLTSRYDTTQMNYWLEPDFRIGLLDRKLRIVTQVCKKKGWKEDKWIEWATEALQSCYGFEWQGDNVLLARENLLYAVLETFQATFRGVGVEIPTVRRWAEIISWNVWQMDGIKFVVPNTCKDKIEEFPNLDGTVDRKVTPCKGCRSGKIDAHNGVRCRVMDWETGKPVLFMPPFEFKPIEDISVIRGDRNDIAR